MQTFERGRGLALRFHRERSGSDRAVAAAGKDQRADQQDVGGNGGVLRLDDEGGRIRNDREVMDRKRRRDLGERDLRAVAERRAGPQVHAIPEPIEPLEGIGEAGRKCPRRIDAHQGLEDPVLRDARNLGGGNIGRYCRQVPRAGDPEGEAIAVRRALTGEGEDEHQEYAHVPPFFRNWLAGSNY